MVNRSVHSDGLVFVEVAHFGQVGILPTSVVLLSSVRLLLRGCRVACGWIVWVHLGFVGHRFRQVRLWPLLILLLSLVVCVVLMVGATRILSILRRHSVHRRLLLVAAALHL